MILYPAIDIRDGHAVRLTRGDYGEETVYDDDPVDAARRWLEQGARALHVVDLDGAREGAPQNLEHVRRIAAEADVLVQLGGGLRDSELAAGLDSGTPFYFVHSFAVRPADDADVLATAEWGERFACAVARPPLYGVQFHPEKSSAAGLRLLANFVEICAKVTA